MRARGNEAARGENTAMLPVTIDKSPERLFTGVDSGYRPRGRRFRSCPATKLRPSPTFLLIGLVVFIVVRWFAVLGMGICHCVGKLDLVCSKRLISMYATDIRPRFRLLLQSSSVDQVEQLMSTSGVDPENFPDDLVAEFEWFSVGPCRDPPEVTPFLAEEKTSTLSILFFKRSYRMKISTNSSRLD